MEGKSPLSRYFEVGLASCMTAASSFLGSTWFQSVRPQRSTTASTILSPLLSSTGRSFLSTMRTYCIPSSLVLGVTSRLRGQGFRPILPPRPLESSHITVISARQRLMSMETRTTPAMQGIRGKVQKFSSSLTGLDRQRRFPTVSVSPSHATSTLLLVSQRCGCRVLDTIRRQANSWG